LVDVPVVISGTNKLVSAAAHDVECPEEAARHAIHGRDVGVDQVLEPEPVGIAEICLGAEMDVGQRQVDPVPLDQRRELG
jgi:hypothetical protein